MLRNADQGKHAVSCYARKSSGGDTSELGSGSVEKQQCALIGLKGTEDALENLPGSIRKFVVRCSHGPHLGDRSQNGKEAEEF